MNTNGLLIPKIINALLLIGDIILIILINSNFNYLFKKTFTLFLLLLIVVMLLYLPKVTLKNNKKIKAVNIRAAFKKFIIFFAVTIIFYSTVDVIFTRFTLMQIFLKCFLISSTLAFMDITL